MRFCLGGLQISAGVLAESYNTHDLNHRETRGVHVTVITLHQNLSVREDGAMERITGERVGRETVHYVGNIYQYYVAYSLALQQMQDRAAAKQKIKGN